MDISLFFSEIIISFNFNEVSLLYAFSKNTCKGVPMLAVFRVNQCHQHGFLGILWLGCRVNFHSCKQRNGHLGSVTIQHKAQCAVDRADG